MHHAVSLVNIISHYISPNSAFSQSLLRNTFSHTKTFYNAIIKLRMVIIASGKTKVDEKVVVAELALPSSSLIHSVPSSLDSAPSSQTQKLVVG